MSGNAPPQGGSGNSFAMIRTLAGVSVISGLLIVLVVNATEARIQRNKEQALARAVFGVLDGATSRKTFRVDGEVLVPDENPAPGADRVYAAYDDSGALVGVALEAMGQGYGGAIETLFGYNPDSDSVVGFNVLGSLETPGLGDRIGKDPEFLANFSNLDATLAPEGSGLAHAIEWVKQGTKQNAWEVDGISGATISSKAVADMIDARCQQILPVIQANLDMLKGGA